eukprot:5077763-Prymnesium_polylepis.1
MRQEQDRGLMSRNGLAARLAHYGIVTQTLPYSAQRAGADSEGRGYPHSATINESSNAQRLGL